MHVRRIVDETARQLASRARAVLVRVPAIDPDLPDTSDLDFLVFADIDDLYPESLEKREGEERRMIDLTWLPSAWLENPEFLASHGLIAHRLATSELVHAETASIARRCAAATESLYRADIHEKRVCGFLEMGRLTVRELGITRDFPALSLFWLHIAYSACLAAALDAMRRCCPNVYTRPFGYLAELERLTGLNLSATWIDALRCDADVTDLIAAVRRLHRTVAERYSEPAWPAAMRATTIFEYCYWLRREQMEWRIRVAQEMFERGQKASAVHYLRFYAYALARAPIIHMRAAQGADVSYLRPDKAMLPELQRLCPDILEDLNLALAGERTPDLARVDDGLAALHEFRDAVVATLRARGLNIPPAAAWIPYQSLSREAKEALCRS